MKKKICIVVAPSFVLFSLYRNQMAYLMEKGFDITAIASPGEEHQWLRDQGIKTVELSMAREPSILKDIISLFRLILHFSFHRYDIVHVSTPKASLLGSIAARMTFHKKVLYTLRGRVYENYTGIKLKIFEIFEYITCGLVSKVISISQEMGDDVVKKGLCSPKKMHVIGSGSSNGVDLNIFTLTPDIIEEARALRNKSGIPQDALVILSVGRIRREKGINELVRVFKRILQTREDVYLVLQGHYEEVDPLDSDVKNDIETCDKIHHIQWNKNVSVAYGLADILAFPSHREGFGNVAIEASAMELPIVSYNVVGCRESVSDQVSGILVEKENEDALYDALLLLLKDKLLRQKFGRSGRERVEREFKSEVVWDGLISFYQRLLGVKS